jgi:hypothetical protein
MNTVTTTTSALTTLAEYLARHGAIKTVRVSSAQAKGYAKNFAYWGAVRYCLRLDREGRPVNVALERARSIRRSEALAYEDAQELAEREGRIPCQRIGRLTEEDAREVLEWLGI